MVLPIQQIAGCRGATGGGDVEPSCEAVAAAPSDATSMEVPGFQRGALAVPWEGPARLTVLHGTGMLVDDDQVQRFQGPCMLLTRGGSCEVVNLGATALALCIGPADAGALAPTKENGPALSS
jgi:hypothetical protein